MHTQRRLFEMRAALDNVYLHKVLHDRALPVDFPAPEYVDDDIGDFMDIIYHTLHSLSDAIWSRVSDQNDTETLYFSHPAIMEYYRLCREYGKLTGESLRENPYMHHAAEFVRSKLQQGCYSCDYWLQTKINHKWASGIVFRIWPEFNGLFALTVLMLQIFSFYEKEVEKLKAEIDEIKKSSLQKQVLEAA